MTAYQMYFQAIERDQLPATIPLANGIATAVVPLELDSTRDLAFSTNSDDRVVLAIYAIHEAIESAQAQGFEVAT